jgi:uncharacterized protein YkwD
MKDLYIFIQFCAILFILVSCKKENTDPGIYDNAIFEEVNSYRIGLGLNPLDSSGFMWNLAHEHSQAMADGDISFGHDGVTERYELIRGVYGNGTPAENIDWGTGTAKDVVLRWSESIGHNVNISGDFDLTAVSAVKGKDGKYYYTQLFYKKD